MGGERRTKDDGMKPKRSSGGGKGESRERDRMETEQSPVRMAMVIQTPYAGSIRRGQRYSALHARDLLGACIM